LAFANFLVWRLRIGACSVGLVVFGAYDSYPHLAPPKFPNSGQRARAPAFKDLIALRTNVNKPLQYEETRGAWFAAWQPGSLDGDQMSNPQAAYRSARLCYTLP